MSTAIITTPAEGVMAAAEVVLAVAQGRVRHDYQGLCPDEVEGFDARDPGCKACNLLVDAMQNGRSATRSEVDG